MSSEFTGHAAMCSCVLYSMASHLLFFCLFLSFFLSSIFSYDIVQEVELLVAQTSGSVYVCIVYISYCCIELMQNNLDWNLFSLLHEFFVFVLYVLLRGFFLQNVFGIWNDFFVSSTLQSYKPKNRHLLPCIGKINAYDIHLSTC